MEREGSGAIQIVLRLNGSLNNLLTVVSSGTPTLPSFGSKSIRLVLWFPRVSPGSSAVFSIFNISFSIPFFATVSVCQHYL